MGEDVKWFDPELGTPVVTISRTGLTFNAAAVGSLSNASRVQVGVKADEHSFIVKVAEGPQGSLPFYREDSTNKFVRISSKDLVRFLSSNLPEIDLDTTTKYLARAEVPGATLVVDVRQTVKSRSRKDGDRHRRGSRMS